MPAKIVAGFGVLIIGVGLVMALSPGTMFDFAERIATPGGLGFAASVRVALGVVLWLAADASRTPKTLKVLGVLFVVGGLGVLAIGVDRMRAMVDWGIVQGDGWMRAMSLIALAMGPFLVWTIMTRKKVS